MSRSARGSRRGGSNARGAVPDGSVVPASSGAPADAHAVLEAVAANPSLQGAHVIVRQLIQKGIDEVQQPLLRSQMTQCLDDMLQGQGVAFKALQGGLLPPSPPPVVGDLG